MRGKQGLSYAVGVGSETAHAGETMPRPKIPAVEQRRGRRLTLTDATWQGLQRIADRWDCSKSEAVTRIERLIVELWVTS